ncbi:hypothetical protein H8S90_05985 [Olivibacter sp. SDN3]|uniref:hypothetical protein n=1 Tax=Olivibacter sp. SDN3 TaxID=2764720 RepID=UPI0016515775|nr:hypothetical protein [Olivibacter sp. SDN3]QNL51131.1 hypothetical protein H8S90_05985 [Olivibacter sp. SDN3]
MEENDVVYKRHLMTGGYEGEDDTNKEINKGDNNKDSTKVYFFIVAIIALLATNVYFYLKYKNSDSQNITITSEKSQMEAELDRIELELDRVTKANLALSEALKSERENARLKIEELRAKLTQNELDRADMQKTQQEITQLRQSVAKYSKDAERLKNENRLLLSERDSLKVSMNHATAKAQELEDINQELESKVNIASALKISSININAFRVRKNGRENIETRARRADKLKIDFNIAENAIAKEAIYDIYVRIIEPNGNLLIRENNIFEADGVELQYTYKTGIEFSNDGKLYSIEWPGIEGFKPGTYTVVLYTNKGTMGRGTIRLS